jgi:hypothetical protein
MERGEYQIARANKVDWSGARYVRWPKVAIAATRPIRSPSGDNLPCPCSRLVQACHLRSTELQAEAEDHAKFVVPGTPSAYLLGAMKFNSLPAGFIIPAQPVMASKPPSGADWVHEIKHDGYRLIVRRDGTSVRLYSRNANDWTARLSTIATTARRIKAKSFTIDGETVAPGPDGLSRFEELRSREAAHATILYAFDLIERDDEDITP